MWYSRYQLLNAYWKLRTWYYTHISRLIISLGLPFFFEQIYSNPIERKQPSDGSFKPHWLAVALGAYRLVPIRFQWIGRLWQMVISMGTPVGSERCLWGSESLIWINGFKEGSHKSSHHNSLFERISVNTYKATANLCQLHNIWMNELMCECCVLLFLFFVVVVSVVCLFVFMSVKHICFIYCADVLSLNVNYQHKTNIFNPTKMNDLNFKHRHCSFQWLQYQFILYFQHFYGVTQFSSILTSSTFYIFRVSGPLWGESAGHRRIPLTKTSDAELWCFLWSAPDQTVGQTIKKPVILGCHRAHYDVTVMHTNHSDVA